MNDTSDKSSPPDNIDFNKEAHPPTENSRRAQETVLIQESLEKMRQNREDFDAKNKTRELLLKRFLENDAKWFDLRLRMGYVAVFGIPTIGAFCIYILMNHENFTTTIVTSASAALFVDVLGLITSIYKLVLNPSSNNMAEVDRILASINQS